MSRERVLDAAGPAAPPRRNGDLVFDAPWQSRLFGLTMALHEAGVFGWADFRGRLMAAIAEWERDARGEWSYWERWLVAFERLCAERGLCAPGDVEARQRELAERPPGHDHDHDH